MRVRTRVTLVSPGTELRLFRGEPMVSMIWESFADLDAHTMRQAVRHYRLTAPNQPGVRRFPTALGYNSVGEVTELGDDVRNHHVGDRVFTLSRHQELCDVLDWQAIRIPDGVPDEAAAFCYLAALGLHALRRGSFVAGENVAVIGLGAVGLCTALVADACGASVICLDLEPTRLEIAARAARGALVLSPLEPGFATTLEGALAPHGVDLAIDAAEGAASLDLALRLVDNGGRVVVAALHPEEVGALLSSNFYVKQAAVLGTSSDPYEDPGERRTRFTTGTNIAHILDLQRRHRLSLEPAHTHTYRAEQIAEAYADLAEGRRDMVGVLLDWR